MPRNEREAAGISDDLVRLSVGCEDVRDLIADLAQALGEAAKARPAEVETAAPVHAGVR